jgi:quinol monooxygenase YgiN
MALLSISRHWVLAAFAVVLFGAAWLAAGTTLGAVAQMTSPAWARARALGVCQVAFFGAQALGSTFWGSVASRLGVPIALALCAATGALTAAAARRWRLSTFAPDKARTWAKKLLTRPLPAPPPPAPAVTALLHSGSGRVLEAVHYRVDPANRDAFLAAMREVHHVRLRAGALVWRLYEDVARPDRWIELWAMESWTEHLREATRLDEADLAALARAAAMHRGDEPLEVSRYLNVDPEQVVHHAEHASVGPVSTE